MHDLTEHSDSQGIQGKSQRLTSNISNTPLTKPHHGINNTVCLPRLEISLPSQVMHWNGHHFGMDLMLQSTQIHKSQMSRN